MSDRIIAQAIVEGKLDGRPWGYEADVTQTITAQLYSYGGKQDPYFSVTHEVTSRNGHVCACGCGHEDILATHPELAPVVLVHLADEHGVPMHAVENAVYWGGGTKWTPDVSFHEKDYPVVTDNHGSWNPAMLAHHLRVTVEKATELRESTFHYDGSRKEAWTAVVDTLRAQWQAEADEALAVIKALS